MNTIRSYCQAIMCINLHCHRFKPKNKSKGSFPKQLMAISVMYLNNVMIKLSENGGLVSVSDSVTQKVLLSDTILRLFIPPQVRKIAPKLRQICGFEFCIIPQDMQIDLNTFIKYL